MGIMNLITESKENLENAQTISELLFDAQNDIWEKAKTKIKIGIELAPEQDDNWNLYYNAENSKKIGMHFNSEATKNDGLASYHVAGVILANNKIESKHNEVNISTLILNEECFNKKIDEYMDWIKEQLENNKIR